MKNVILVVQALGQVGQLGVENQIEQMLVKSLKILGREEELPEIILNLDDEI